MGLEVGQPVWVRVEGTYYEGVIEEIKLNFINSYEIKVTDTNKMQVYNVIVPIGLLKERIIIVPQKGNKNEV